MFYSHTDDVLNDDDRHGALFYSSSARRPQRKRSSQHSKVPSSPDSNIPTCTIAEAVEAEGHVNTSTSWYDLFSEKEARSGKI